MTNARDEDNNHRFCREEWLSKVPIKSCFTHLASTRRKGQETEDVDEETSIEDKPGLHKSVKSQTMGDFSVS